MANIEQELYKIQNARYGADVRQSIYDGIEKINNDVKENGQIVQNTKSKQDLLEQKYNEQIKNMANSEPQSPEIVDAREGFETLGGIIKQKIFHFNNIDEMKKCIALGVRRCMRNTRV